MTAHYNGYFNAKEIIKESMKAYRETQKEDFTKILPIYLYADESSASALYPEMDRAILKTSTVIKKHSMPNPEKVKQKKNEWCKWIDDNWLVMGQAHFYKREFDAAIEKFKYIQNTYRDSELQYDAQIWIARSYQEMGRLNEAQSIIDRLQGQLEDAEKQGKKKKEKTRKTKKKTKKQSEDKNPPPFPERLKKDLVLLQTDQHIRKKEYDKAADKLIKGIALTRKKREKARLTFILAQLYQASGNNSAASEAYARIPKLNPTFEMEFYSRIFRALMYQGGDSRGIRAELMKLLKDEKNKEFYDQIYYALAELELKDQHRDQGVNYLKKSVEASVNNDRQKGKSYLRLGEIAFNERDYVPAKTYYDSGIGFLPKDYPELDKIRKKSESLTELVTHLNTISLQDSLLKLASLPQKKREEAIEKIIEKEKEEAERKRLADEAKANESSKTNLMAESGGWYFYNQQTKGMGFNEFKKIWGTRKLEDDWRRSNKTSVSEGELLPENGDSLISATEAKDLKRKEQLLSGIPSGPDAISDAKKKIQYALYHAGVIFKDRLTQTDLAVKMFKDLLSRYDYGEFVLPANYQLYLIYSPKPESEPYKNTILNDYGDSEYAMLIRNPNYKKEGEALLAQQEKAYLEVYDLYRKKQFEASLEACNKVIAAEPQNSMLSKYYFLRALNYGELKRMDELEQALSVCAEKYASEETGKEAQSILDYLRNKKSKENPIQGFVFESDAEHFFIMVFPNSLGSIVDAKTAFSDFNGSFFSSKNLKITNNFLDADNQLIIVKQFPDKKSAMEYYQAVSNKNDRLKNYKNATCFVITGKNYSAFFLEKKIDVYMKFFSDNYLN